MIMTKKSEQHQEYQILRGTVWLFLIIEGECLWWLRPCIHYSDRKHFQEDVMPVCVP